MHICCTVFIAIKGEQKQQNSSDITKYERYVRSNIVL